MIMSQRSAAHRLHDDVGPRLPQAEGDVPQRRGGRPQPRPLLSGHGCLEGNGDRHAWHEETYAVSKLSAGCPQVVSKLSANVRTESTLSVCNASAGTAAMLAAHIVKQCTARMLLISRKSINRQRQGGSTAQALTRPSTSQAVPPGPGDEAQTRPGLHTVALGRECCPGDRSPCIRRQLWGLHVRLRCDPVCGLTHPSNCWQLRPAYEHITT